MIVAIVFLLIVGTLLILQQVKGLRRKSTPSEEELKLRSHVANLEQRVRTLERIATDKSASLKEEINTL
jgi:predicted Holliday junction resolvase-like endonuclease